MTTPPIRRRAALLGAGGLLAAPAVARAQAPGGAYPSRPVRLIVPFPPGNMSDLIGRVIVEEMQTRHGVTVVVENRPGGTGAIGIQAVTRSAPDGYNLLLSSNSPLVVNPAVTRNLPFDVQRDLVPMALVGGTGFLIVVPPDFPARNLAEAIAVFKAAPAGRYSAANPGTGTFGHLVTEQIMQVTGTRLEHVPYRGSAQALLDLSQGRVHMMVDAMTSSLPQVQGGRVRALCVLAGQRSALAPDIPTLGESGMPQLESMAAMGWTGLLGPTGTPPAVIEYWNRQINALLQDPAFGRRLASQNVEAAQPGPPSRLAELIARELPRFVAVATEAKIELTN
ncbi:Bug family tripartite tricarboxylate transporter substrate binding protein [Falsiroseomonas oryzae]|uniref:Bug family tripartite tricarboxylate transporter substrate binding protein n=1 Tax=Falsiroseomonas oryzae TaxID=2766473 RepID=UPI0022EB211B|nr:tripartite tricarboxylate transporter substrate binding protein [Roseomonas sp. MO-31]